MPDPTNVGNFILVPVYTFMGYVTLESSLVDYVYAEIIKNYVSAGLTVNINKVTDSFVNAKTISSKNQYTYISN